MLSVAEWARKIPFQRAIDRHLEDIEAILADGYTYRSLVAVLAAHGFALADGRLVTIAYLGGAVSRARAKVRTGKRRAGQPARSLPGTPPPRSAPLAAPPSSPPARPGSVATVVNEIPLRQRRGLESLAINPKREGSDDSS